MFMKTFQKFFKETIDQIVGGTKRFRSLRHLSETAGVSSAVLTKYLKGGTDTPDFDILNKIDDVAGTSLQPGWYQMRYGPKAVVPPPGFEDMNFIPASELCQRKAPVFTVEAGGFLFDNAPDDYPLGESDRYEWTSSTDPNALFVEVSGESMTGAGINEGDLLELEPNKEVRNGDIVVCRKNGSGSTVKKMIIKENHIILQPMNPAYDPIMITREESQECKFIKVSEVRRKL